MSGLRRPFTPCCHGCPGWALMVSDSAEKGLEAQRCDACWSGVDNAPDDDHYSTHPFCRAVLCFVLGEDKSEYPGIDDETWLSAAESVLKGVL